MSELPTSVIATLEKWDMQTQDAPDVGSDGVFSVYDSEGEFLFRITSEIQAWNLQQMLMFASSQFKLGERLGRAGLQAGLRALLDVDKRADPAP